MRCGFRPHDRDRTTESMEGSLLGFGPLWKGFGMQRERGVSGYAVNRWSTKRPPNCTKLTGGLPVLYQGCLARLGPFRESLTYAHNERKKGNAGGHRSAGLQNGQRGKGSDA